MIKAAILAAWIVGAGLVAEFIGYLLHRLLHSGRIAFLSRNHMKHHMLLYAPLQKQRPSDKYLHATTAQVAVGNIGLEWIIPSLGLLGIVIAISSLLRVPWVYEIVLVGTILAWSFLMFSYLHDRMHIKNFWLERAPILKQWFVPARRLHDIHHHAINSDGLMNKNFGIGFFLFDRLFRTFTEKGTPFDATAYQLAEKRLGCMMGSRSRRLSIDACDQALLPIMNNIEDAELAKSATSYGTMVCHSNLIAVQHTVRQVYGQASCACDRRGD